MSKWRCSAQMRLLIVTMGLASFSASGRTWAGGPPAPAKTAQRILPTPEPPSAGPMVPALASPPPISVPGLPCPVDPPVPAVAIRVRVPSQAASGQDLEYRICVENQSCASAHHVRVRNPLPANAEYVRSTPEPLLRGSELLWDLGTLERCARREILLVLRPTGAGDITNCARVVYEHGQCVTTRVGALPAIPAPQLPPTQPPAMQPVLRVRKIGPTQAILYDPVTYKIEVANLGMAPLNNVLLTDILPKELQYDSGTPQPERKALLTWNLGTIAPGQTRNVEYRALTLKEGTFTNRAMVTADGGLREEATSRVTVGKADLKLNMMGPERRYANLPATYELTVSNPGNVVASNVVLTNPLPPTARFVRASEGGVLLDNRVEWLLGTLAPGGRRTVRLQLSAQRAGEIVNRATVKADRDLTAMAEIKTLFQGFTGLSASITDEDPVAVGHEAAYLILVRNTGTADATEVRVSAMVPVQMQATDAQGPSKATREGGMVRYEPITLKPGEEVRYRLVVKAMQPGDVRFRVDIEAKELIAGPLREEESTTVFQEQPIPALP